MTTKTKLQITRRNLLVAAGAFAVPLAAPAVVRGQGQVRLTLGHGAAPGNPRSVAAERMAPQLQRAQQRPHRDARRRLGAARRRPRHADRPAHRHARHVGEQPGPDLDGGAGTGRLRPALPVPDQPGRLPGHRRPGRAGARASKLEGGRADLARLVGQRHPPHHQQQAPDQRARPTCAASRSAPPPTPSTIDTFQALGAATQQINFSELYVALQQGVVDGQENPLANIHSAKLHEVNRFISLSSPQVAVLALRRLAHRLGTAERGRPQADHRGRRERRPSTTGKLMMESDEKLLAEYRANPAV